MLDLMIREVEKDEAIRFVRLYHYSKILPRITKFYLGIYKEETLLGVVTLGYGTQPLQTIKKIFYKHEMVSGNYLEIGKMCFVPHMNNNRYFGSYVLSLIVKWMKKNTNCLFLYTLADGIMGKCGYVYQASNFIYLGKFKTCVYLDNNTGEKIHPRSSKLLLRENEDFEGVDKLYWLTYDFCEYKGIDKINGYMFRYIYPLNKNAKKIINEYEEYSNTTYPKDLDLYFERRCAKGKYEQIEKPNFNMNAFKYNTQRIM